MGGGSGSGGASGAGGANTAGAPQAGANSSGAAGIGGNPVGVGGAGGAAGAAGGAGSGGGAGGGPVNLNPPSVPSGVKVGAGQTCSNATLTWDVSTANPAGAPLHGYQVYVNGVHRFTTLSNQQSLMLLGFNFGAGVPYTITVAAYADDGSVSAQSQPFTFIPLGCTNAPAAPTQVQATATGCREVRVSWQAATQAGPNDAVYGYFVYRDGTRVSGLVPQSPYVDFGAAAGVAHTYSVQTDSNQALTSAPVPVQVTTPPCTDVTPPSAPTQLTGAALKDTCLYLGLTWTAATDDTGVHHYNVYRDGILLDSVTPRTLADVADLVMQVTSSYTVTAVDAAGNESPPSAAFSFSPDCSASISKARHLKAAVMLANFPDVLKQPVTVSQANDTTFGSAGSLSTYLSESTYGTLDISGSVFGWYTMPQGIDSYCTGPGHNSCSGGLEQAIRTAAKADMGGAVFDRFISVAAGIGAAGEGGGDGMLLADWAFALDSMGHELGHTLFLAHSGDLTCSAGDLTPHNLLDLSEGGCEVGRYGDGYDIMGAGNVGQYSTYKKEILGALGPSQVAIAKESGSYTLEVMETKGSGIKELRIPLEINGFFYFLEYRKPIGTDAVKPVDGVLIRLRARSALTDADTFRLHTVINPDTPFYDRYRNIRVEVTNKTDTQITLKVTR